MYSARQPEIPSTYDLNQLAVKQGQRVDNSKFSFD